MPKQTRVTLQNNAPCCAPKIKLRMRDAEAHALAAAFKAVGHPVRLQILDLLSRSEGQLCVCDIEACFSLTQPTISHHLRVLREAGLVGAEQRGLWAHYYVRYDNVAPLRAFLDRLQPAQKAIVV